MDVEAISPALAVQMELLASALHPVLIRRRSIGTLVPPDVSSKSPNFVECSENATNSEYEMISAITSTSNVLRTDDAPGSVTRSPVAHPPKSTISSRSGTEPLHNIHEKIEVHIFHLRSVSRRFEISFSASSRSRASFRPSLRPPTPALIISANLPTLPPERSCEADTTHISSHTAKRVRPNRRRLIGLEDAFVQGRCGIASWHTATQLSPYGGEGVFHAVNQELLKRHVVRFFAKFGSVK